MQTEELLIIVTVMSNIKLIEINFLKRLNKNKIWFPSLLETRLVFWKVATEEANMYTLDGIDTQLTSKWTGSDIAKDNFSRASFFMERQAKDLTVRIPHFHFYSFKNVYSFTYSLHLRCVPRVLRLLHGEIYPLGVLIWQCDQRFSYDISFWMVLMLPYTKLLRRMFAN